MAVVLRDRLFRWESPLLGKGMDSSLLSLGRSNAMDYTCLRGLGWAALASPMLPASHGPFTYVTLAGVPSSCVCIARTFPVQLSQ